MVESLDDVLKGIYSQEIKIEERDDFKEQLKNYIPLIKKGKTEDMFNNFSQISDVRYTKKGFDKVRTDASMGYITGEQAVKELPKYLESPYDKIAKEIVEGL